MNKKRVLSFALCLLMLVTSSVCVMAEEFPIPGSQIKNIIYMIPDGGAMEPFKLAEAVKEAGGFNREVYPNATETEKGPMYLSDYLVGAETTHSADNAITDSAAAGTALSSGYKTNNGYIGVDPQGAPRATILEASQAAGKNVGLVATYEWMHATPAAFSSHDISRYNYTPMSEQIVNQGIDVVLGAGFGAAQWGSVLEAQKRGYSIINTREELEAVKPGDKVWGNLVSDSFPFDVDRKAETPNLAEMTKAAITALSDSNENGFFLMVEGSKVDTGGHSNVAVGMVSEYLAFDKACEVAIEFAKGRSDTLVVVLPDHDTGGLSVTGDLAAVVADIQNGKEPAGISWETDGHTARNGGVFMYVPEGVAYPEGLNNTSQNPFEENIIDNTVIAKYLSDIIGVDLDALTKQLFVDVTGMGMLDPESEMFTFFNDPKYSIERNTSYVYTGDKIMSLDGQVAVFVNDRFYVPQLLLDIRDGKAEGQEDPTVYPVRSSLYTYMPVMTDVTKWNAEITVINDLAAKEVSGKIQFTSPASFAVMGPIDMGTVGGGETKVITVECPQFDPLGTGFTIGYDIITDDGKTYSFTSPFKAIIYAGYANTPITIDGVIGEEEWANSVELVCNDGTQIVNFVDWGGESDLSANYSVMWDEEYFYLYAKVRDNVFFPEKEAVSLWNADSVQFGIYNGMPSGDAISRFEEIGIAYIDQKPTAYRYLSQSDKISSGLIEGDSFEMQCALEGDVMTYELKYKWSDLLGYEYQPMLGSTLAFSALANDNDGVSRRGWIEYGSGIGTTKDANKFATLLMLDPSQIDTGEIKVLYNGAKVNFDVPPMIIDDRTMVPVRAVFEALGASVDWNAETATVISSMGDSTVTLQINSTIMMVNGEEKVIDVPAQIVADRTLVPLRAISEAYGCDVGWDGDTRTVTITK